jgi:hypothetical protein
MTKADYYRQLSAECARMAQRSTNVTSQAVLLHMAEVWAKLATEHQAILTSRDERTGTPRTDPET